jgi:V/A-type H+/Na+-transporting ATPase subunit C
MAGLIDRINLVWLLRYRFNYGLPPAQVYYLLLASRYSLSGTLLRESGGTRQPGSGFGRAADEMAGSPGRCGGRTRRVFAAWNASLPSWRARPFVPVRRGLARAFAYLILRERDLRAVRAVLRGRHLGLSDAAIRFALQRTPEMVM